jgi:hypothetical protein
MKASLRGRTYRIVPANLRDRLGDCDPPDTPNPKIRIDNGIRRNRDRMMAVIHEVLHACQWDLSEEAVAEISRDMANVLHKLGARIRIPP